MGRKSDYVPVLILSGFLALSLFAADARAAGEPEIINSFAAKELVPRDSWKIYIKAFSPDARMQYFFATVDQAGGMPYPVSMTRIKEEDQKRVSGFLFLYTQSAGSGMDFVTLKLTIQIKDDKGRFSDPAIFPLTLKPRAAPEAPPPGIFQEKDLGPIMIRLRPVADDGSSHDN